MSVGIGIAASGRGGANYMSFVSTRMVLKHSHNVRLASRSSPYATRSDSSRAASETLSNNSRNSATLSVRHPDPSGEHVESRVRVVGLLELCAPYELQSQRSGWSWAGTVPRRR